MGLDRANLARNQPVASPMRRPGDAARRHRRAADDTVAA